MWRRSCGRIGSPTDKPNSGIPNPATEQAETERTTLRSGEDEAVLTRIGNQVRSEFLSEESREAHSAASGRRLERFLDPKLTTQQVEPIDAQGGQLAGTQTGVGAGQNEGPVAGPDGFGDPETRGRQEGALACVRMAIAMRTRIHELREEWQEQVGSSDLHVRIGINTGYCTVGNFGSEDRLDYTIVGGPVNAASRLESTAAPDQIQISQDTYALIKDKIYRRPIGEVKVKGIAHELRTFEVVGPLEEIEAAAEIRAAAGGFNLQLDPASMDHREAEMARQALRQALAVLDPADDD